MRTILAILFAVLPLLLPAQQGSGAKALMSLAALAPAPTNAPKFFLWESSAPRFAVYTGVTRATATNRVVIATNLYARKSNEVAFVAPITAAGVELKALGAYAPSNAVYVPVLYYTTDLKTWVRGKEFPEVTNTPVQLLRLVNEFKRWE